MNSNDYDALIFPTWNNPPRLVGDMTSPSGNNSGITAPPTGFPAITVPMGYTVDDTLPAGLQFWGRAFDEQTLIGLAYSYEQATMYRRPSPLFAALPGEEFEYEPVPEASSTAALAVFGLAVLGLKLKRKHRIKQHDVQSPFLEPSRNFENFKCSDKCRKPVSASVGHFGRQHLNSFR